MLYLVVSVEVGGTSASSRWWWSADWCRGWCGTVGMAAVSGKSDLDTAWLIRNRLSVDVVSLKRSVMLETEG